MSADFWCEEDEPVKLAPAWMKNAIGERCCTCAFEPCQMADATNFERKDDDDGVDKDTKMAAEDEKIRVLRYIGAICLDRPCPSCKYEVADRPHRDLRQCRACGELWGFDDSQTMDEFVREFRRMDPCQGCGASGLDDLQIAVKHARQELVCLRCKTVLDIGPSPDTHRDEDFDFLDPEGHHRSRNAGRLNASEDINKEETNLTCPNCPCMTEEFFEKTFERDSLVLAVCPACNNVVFGNGTQAEAKCDKRTIEAEKNTPKFGGGRAPAAKRTKQRFSLRMCNLAQRKPKPGSKDEDDQDVKQLMSRMGGEVGMTVGTELGSIVLKHMELAKTSGPVGAVVRKAICEEIHRSAAKMGIVCRNCR